VHFVYNRPFHTQQVLNSLAANDEAGESTLYVFCDGPKIDASEEELQSIDRTRDIVKREVRFKDIFISEKDLNVGLANSIIGGVTEVINKYDKAIVLEDDLIVSPFFLYYMNDSLVRYEHNSKVGQIGACNFFACGSKYPSTFFTPIPDCLGWATWKNRWDFYDVDAVSLLKQLEDKNLTYRFNLYEAYDMVGLIKMHIEGKVNSWAIRWQAVCIINDWLTLYPNPSFTNHIESKNATHANINITPPICSKKPKFKTIDVKEISTVIDAMKKGYAGTGDYYGNTKKTSRNSIVRIILKKLKVIM